MEKTRNSLNGISAAAIQAEAEIKLKETEIRPEEISQFDVRPDGVYFIGEPKSVEKICGPLRVVAETQTETGENYGRLLEWTDSKNRKHEWAMPIELVHSDSNEHIKYLVSRGLELRTGKRIRDRLSLYLATSKPKITVVSTDKVGWHNHVFVFPESTIGNLEENERVAFQSAAGSDHRFRTEGALTDWQANVAHLCAGNSRLVFAVSTAFASCLLTPLVEDGGGFHYRGSSSLGKSTALLVAGSVWGGGGPKGFLRSWQTTATGLEIVASLHNDSLLCLDELKRCDPRTAGEAAYMIASGEGKNRGTKNISVRRTLTWNLLFLSNGELSLSDHLRQGGERLYGGQEVRMCDIPADAEKGLGLFENIYNLPTAELFAKKLAENSKNFYGTAIREFLQQVSVNLNSLKDRWVSFRSAFMNDVLPENPGEEVQRVAARFALVAFGGWLAKDICGWNEQESWLASKKLFQAWLDSRGTNGQTDAENAVRNVRAFFEAHGNSRFQDEKNPDARIYDRAGFIKQNHVTLENEFVIYPETFSREICKGFDAKFVANELARRGILEIRDELKEIIKSRQLKMDELKKSFKPDGGDPRKMFFVNSKIFE